MNILENSEILVSGPGIEIMKNTFHVMAGRGAPVQDDEYGFNKPHFNLYQRIAYLLQPGQAIPAHVAVQMLDALQYYKKKQLTNYPQIAELVKKDLEAVQKSNISDNIFVFDQEPQEYGKIKVFVPNGFDPALTKRINTLVDQQFEKEGEQKAYNDYGKEVYPRFKKFSKEKTGIYNYRFHTSVLPQVLELLKSVTGLDAVFQSGSKPDLATTPQQNTQAPEVQAAEIEIMGLENTSYGKKLAIKFNVPFNQSKSVFDSLKSAGLSPKGISYASGPSRFLINIDDLGLFNKVKEQIAKSGLNIKPLENFAASHFQQKDNLDDEDVSGSLSKMIAFTNLAGNKMKIKLDYGKLNQKQKQFLKESIQYTFPEYRWLPTEFAYEISGNYKQYVLFGRLLAKENEEAYNVPDLRQMVKEKLVKKELEKTGVEGKYDDNQELMDSIESKLPNSKVDLYKQQKEGVAFLYGRDHAILGDETGFGKCQAGETRIQTSHGTFEMQDLWKKFASNIRFLNDGEWADCPEDLYVHSMDENEKIVKKRVSILYRQRVREPLKEVITSNGKKILATLPHKFYTVDGWKSEITNKDYICSSSNQFSLNTNNFNDLNFTKLLAWQISEGYENKKISRVTISQNDKTVLDELKTIYDKMEFYNKLTKLPSKAIIKKTKKNKVHELIINCRNYRNYLEEMGYKWGRKSSAKKIPEFIMQANDDVVKTFLGSYFDAEAYVNPNSRQIEISSASKEIIFQLSLLLQRFNILCSFSERMKMATNSKRIKRKYYLLYVCGTGVCNFFENIKLDCEYKASNYYNINTKPNTNKEGKPAFKHLMPFFKKYKLPYRLMNVPSAKYISGDRWTTNQMLDRIIEGFEDLKSGLVLKKYESLKKSKWTNSVLPVLNNIKMHDIDETIETLKKMRQNDLQYEKVKSVNLIDYDDYVYDLSIEDTHNYISENLICHNTIQMISAAELKMQETNKPTLIITLKATQQQWVNEIKVVLGDQEASEISTDPLNPKKWTVVYYENFSIGKKVNDYVQSLMNADFGIAILDELHKVKHETSKRSQNIAKVLENVPTRWGASATVSSNKPMDVKNQLLILGHHLGKIKEGKFKSDFAGYKPTGYGGAYEESKNIEDRIIAAERLNKWLNISGVYVRRAKSDLREMPNLEVGSQKVPVDHGAFNKLWLDKIKTYKDPNLPVSKLIAAREAIAQIKVPQTVKQALDIVKNNEGAASKIVIFTNFVESGRKLMQQIQEGLKSINPDFYALDYLSDTSKSDRNKLKSRFTNDPNAKIVVMSMRMGGTGIDFPNAAQNMLVNDFDWTPESAEQSEGRIYRINTNHPVKIRYVLTDIVDDKLFEMVQRKRELAQIVQKYRKDFQESDSQEALNQIVKAQKEIEKINRDIAKVVATELPGAELQESFYAFIQNAEAIEKHFFGLE